MADHSIGLLTLWGREALRSRALGTTPVALPDEERTSNYPAIGLSRGLVNDALFGLNHTACLALVVHADDLGAELEGLALGSRGQRLEEGDESLAVYNAAGVKFRHARDGGCSLAGVEVDDLLRGVFEG